MEGFNRKKITVMNNKLITIACIISSIGTSALLISYPAPILFVLTHFLSVAALTVQLMRLWLLRVLKDSEE